MMMTCQFYTNCHGGLEALLCTLYVLLCDISEVVFSLCGDDQYVTIVPSQDERIGFLYQNRWTPMCLFALSWCYD